MSEQPMLLHLQESLDSSSKALEAGDFQKADASISELVESLSSLSDAAISSPDDELAKNNSILVLSHLHSYLSNSSLHQGVIDDLSFVLPKTVAKFAGVSQRCSEIVDSIIDLLIAKCNPRDLISVFHEALELYGETTDAPGYVACVIRGVSIAFRSIQRRHLEQIKPALPILLTAVKAASHNLNGDEEGLKKLFEGAISVANSVLATCKTLEGEANEKLRGLLGLYVLQIMVVSSISLGINISTCLPFVLQLSRLFPYCGLSYADLITGQTVDQLMNVVCGEDRDDYMKPFSFVKHGAVLSVIWGQVSEEVTQAAEQDLNLLKDELRRNQSTRWSAVGMMKFVFYLGNLPWILKEHALHFLIAIIENVIQQELSEEIICVHTLSLISTLQVIMYVIMDAPDASERKIAFAAFKGILADNPASLRLYIMHVLVTNCSSSSMTAILLDCVRENLRNDSVKLKEAKVQTSNSFWNTGILDLVEHVLKFPTGGPPSLRDEIDAVLSALNLYRYVLIMESTGKTNYTGILSKSNLQKAYDEWFLPLQTLVIITGAEIKNENDQLDRDQLTCDMIGALHTVMFVLHRCVELLQEQMKQPS